MAAAFLLAATILCLTLAGGTVVVAQSISPRADSGGDRPASREAPADSTASALSRSTATETGQSDPSKDLRDLISLLKKQADTKPKDPWDKFAAISTFVSSVIIALIGLYFTYSYNKAESARRELNQVRQNQINELDVIAKFMPYLTGKDEDAKRTSITTIKALAGVQLAAVMAELHPSTGTAEGLEAIAQSSTTSQKDRTIATAAANKIYDSLPRMRVFYATDRARRAESQVSYGSERGPLSLGSAFVSIPQSHRLGTLEQPNLFKLEFKTDPDRHISLREVTDSSEAAYFADLTATVTQEQVKDLLVFVHGFNVSFEFAVLRSAQIAYDLMVSFPVVAFSWPSRGEASGYMQDTESATYAAPHFVEFLEKAVSSAHADRLHIIADGVGARLVVDAMVRLSSKHADVDSKIRNVIMVAPDVDRSWFLSNAKAISEVVGRTTIYVSRDDLRLRAAASVHGSPRLGAAPMEKLPPTGIDVIDVSAGTAGYFSLGVNSVLADIYELVQHDASPEQRHGLRAVDGPEGRHWKLQ